MKLRYASASPFVRKVSITAIETGLDGKIEREAANVWDPATDIGKDNPLGKVPALTTDGGETLIESAVICEYLDTLHDGKKLIPTSGGARWQALRLQALGDGLAETGIRQLLEIRQGGDAARQGWIDRQKMIIERTLGAIEAEHETLSEFGIGPIAIACALGWMEFRNLAPEDWKSKYPKVAAWYEEISERPSLKATEPTE